MSQKRGTDVPAVPLPWQNCITTGFIRRQRRFTFEYPPTGDYLHEISFRERAALAFSFFSLLTVSFYSVRLKARHVAFRTRDDGKIGRMEELGNTVRLWIGSPMRRSTSARYCAVIKHISGNKRWWLYRCRTRNQFYVISTYKSRRSIFRYRRLMSFFKICVSFLRKGNRWINVADNMLHIEQRGTMHVCSRAAECDGCNFTIDSSARLLTVKLACFIWQLHGAM